MVYVLNSGGIHMSAYITVEDLRKHLPDRYINNSIHIYDTLDSTNIRARQLAMENAPHGTVVMAGQQTAGRGRLGRSFFAPQEGIYLSIIIRPDFTPDKAILITPAAAAATAEAIEEVSGHQAKIKWVNDIYIGNRKVCGILTEALTSGTTGQIDALILGIGVNTTLKDFPAELLDIAGAVEGDYDRAQLAALIITKALDLTASIEEKTFLDTYRDRSLLTGRTVNVFKGTYKISPDDEIPSRPARVLGIDDDGGLMVIYTDGTRETLTTGEVTIRF